MQLPREGNNKTSFYLFGLFFPLSFPLLVKSTIAGIVKKMHFEHFVILLSGMQEIYLQTNTKMQMCDNTVFFTLFRNSIIRKTCVSVKTVTIWNQKTMAQLLHGATDNQASVLAVLVVGIAQYLSSGALKINCYQDCDGSPLRILMQSFIQEHIQHIFWCIYS